ncbi:hypothetical protein CUC43_32390 (plasmid) [Bacillus thuringiensis LM1212]|nr:hypothetical protein CUC43_32390 [Bacillus thuringiensis LM1212]
MIPHVSVYKPIIYMFEFSRSVGTIGHKLFPFEIQGNNRIAGKRENPIRYDVRNGWRIIQLDLPTSLYRLSYKIERRAVICLT